ncbi:SRPBCC family protein [Deinococcus sp. Marseille-Q6407]|uniref:SRPBCC family protein n=1 Tax=Deinococcus sp. Marseille-Q6407 TaxID=2969223 RepID=UPI0021C208B9|nr:SRPBCC family protein [Deinococcus sp. Marseille-Q6407]
MFKLFRRSGQAGPQSGPTEPAQTTLSARPEVRRSQKSSQPKGGAAPAQSSAPAKESGQAEEAVRAAGPEPIVLSQTVPMRARPEVLYRLALVPTRRAAWDSNMAESGWVDDAQTLKNGARARFRLVRRMSGLKFEVEYGGLKTSRSGGWRSVRGVGPLEQLSQQWTFQQVQGQPVTQVTLTLRGQVRYRWVRAQVERMLYNMLQTTLLDMQREIDAPTAGRIEELNQEARRQQEQQRKAEKAARKAARKRR